MKYRTLGRTGLRVGEISLGTSQTFRAAARKDQTKEVVIYYRVPADYRILPVNGCYGGIGPRGELLITFFEEAYPIPRTVTHEITSQGGIGRPRTNRMFIIGIKL